MPLHVRIASPMSHSETLIVFVQHTECSETDSKRSESGFGLEITESEWDTLSDSSEEHQTAHDDEYMEAESVHTDATMVSQPGGMHTEPWSVPESLSFTEAVLSHPLFLKTLKADEILHLKHVCKSWATWFNNNNIIIAKVRREDESSDWYFPVLYKLATPAQLFSWSWSGIWHGTAEHSLGSQPRPLPSLDCVPRTWRKWSHPETVAIAGGLLLIRFVRDIVNVPVRTYRCVREHWEPRGYKNRRTEDCMYCNGFSPRGGCSRCITLDNKNWEPLMVVNPLTKAVRFLPAPDCFELAEWDMWSYRHMQVHMRVDDEANSYEVILLYNKCVFVYYSTSERWKCLRFHQKGPWRKIWEDWGWGYNCASAWVGRHLFLADIRFPKAADYLKNPLTAGVLQVFQIDVEAGDWKRDSRFPLRKFTDWIPIIDVTGNDPNEDVSDVVVLRNLELVECMGHIYAVIPARLDEFLHPLEDGTGERPMRWSNYSPLDLKYMPLQFFILQLQGESLVNGLLRIELETTATGWDYKSRRQSLFDKTKSENASGSRPNWFSCAGKGSVIWVSCEDYLLQYDVVSGQTRTQVIPVNWVEETMRFAYRPSFHMKP